MDKIINRKKELRKAIGLRLKQIRKALSLIQEKMARIIGTGRPNYTRIEIGNTFLKHIILLKLATELNVSVDWLICGTGSMVIQKIEDRDVEKKGDLESQCQSQWEKPKNPEIVELLEHMERIPFLYHDVPVQTIHPLGLMNQTPTIEFMSIFSSHPFACLRGSFHSRKRKNQKPDEYPGLLSYIIGMMNATFFPTPFDAVETGRPL